MNVNSGHMTTVHEITPVNWTRLLLQRLGNISRYRVFVGCGSFDRREIEPGFFVGRSVFDGKDTFVSLHVDRTWLIVDYEVGRSREQMQFRNMSRVIPGDLLGLGPSQAVVTLITWRLGVRRRLGSIRLRPRSRDVSHQRLARTLSERGRRPRRGSRVERQQPGA